MSEASTRGDRRHYLGVQFLNDVPDRSVGFCNNGHMTLHVKFMRKKLAFPVTSLDSATVLFTKCINLTL